MVSINCLDIGTEIGNLKEAHVSPAMSMTFPRSYPPPQDIHAAFREHNEVQMRRERKYAERWQAWQLAGTIRMNLL
jgi:hypothetical protein